MSIAAANSSIPRIVRNIFSQQAAQISPSLLSPSPPSSPCTAKKNVNPATNDNLCYSPHDLLSQFHSSVRLTIKRSWKEQGRFFMYEEHSRYDDVSSIPSTVTVSPNELATLLQSSNRSTSDYHYYWTSPIADVAPQSMMTKEFHWLNQLQSKLPLKVQDPRGPSLWMGTAGSGTQCHYDVADNIIVQLFGTKRIRIYPPSVGVYNLHVFPDAHPKARKSQVDFDAYDFLSTSKDESCSSSDDNANRYPHFSTIPNPTMDVILQPGDGLRIPAFWFHHVENGYVSESINRDCAATICSNKGREVYGYNKGYANRDPSVSLNSFALSESMMIARQIFQSASRPMGGNKGVSYPTPEGRSMEHSSSILRALGITLICGLNVVNHGEEKDFIRTYLLEARYSPLLHLGNRSANILSLENESNVKKSFPSPLTGEQQHTISLCIERILPDFHLLDGGDVIEGNALKNGENGIKLLVALHLLELWAVELVGPKSVAKAWECALS